MKKDFIISLIVAVFIIICTLLSVSSNTIEEADSDIFRTNQKNIQILQEGVWRNFEIKGVNIGTGYPGTFPNEFGIDEDTYSRWFKWISEMNANTIRVYKLQSPEFYQAFFKYNQTHSNKLYLIQGVDFREDWMFTEKNLLDSDQKNEIFQDTKTVVDVIHGNQVSFDFENGNLYCYCDDVSDYVLGYMLGIEWDEIFIDYTCRNNEGISPYNGTYISSSQRANAFENFLAQWGDLLLEYEENTYKTQKLISFANWPETDPLVNEMYEKQQANLFENNTEAFVDLENLQLSDKVTGGMFASYNVYPYFPHFLQAGKYTNYIDDEGNRNPYRKYLMELTEHHSCPVIISEYGVPASRNATYRDVWRNLSQGGNTEKEQGIALLKMYEDIQKSNCAGGIVFSWQDEWFKRSWNEKSLSEPNSRAYWNNAQSVEQFYGLLAFEPGDGNTSNYPDGDTVEWTKEDFVTEQRNVSLSMKSDEKYVYFLVQGLDNRINHDYIHIALDVLPNVGTSHTEEYDFSKQVDFLIQIEKNNSGKLLVHDYSNLAVYSIAIKNQSATVAEIYKKADELQLSMTEHTDSFHVVSRASGSTKNHSTSQLPIEEVGLLKLGNGNPNNINYDSNADYCIKDDIVEIRIPWQLLNFYDPSKCVVIDDYHKNNFNIKGISIDNIYAAAYFDDQKNISEFGSYPLKRWETPQWHERLKQSYYILKEAYGKS